MLALLPIAQTVLPLSDAQRLSKACAAAFRARDRAWFEGHLAKDFTYKPLEGEESDREEMLARLGRWFQPFAYRVTPSLTLVSASRAGRILVLVSDLKVVSQPIRPWRTPVTETIVRVESRWSPKGKDWTAHSIVERSTRERVVK